MPRSFPLLHLAACSVVTALAVCTAKVARAEASSWFAASGGPAWLSEHKSSYEVAPSMQLDLGVGSPPSHPAVVGGLFRTTTFFSHGTDLALLIRATTRGFTTGQWGLALDAGGYARWWGKNSTGPIGAISFGMPFALTLTVQGAVGSNDHRTFGAFLGIDLLRLTVYRLGAENHWPNPRPAWRPEHR